MSKAIPAYLETGHKRVVAGAIEWPGWCRIAKDEDAASQALEAYRERYQAAIQGSGLRVPPGRLEIIERIDGNAGTDFGVPSLPCLADSRPFAGAELARQRRLLDACWAHFDSVARAARGKSLSTGPRGGGRDVAKIIAHVFEADRAYISKLGRPSKATVMQIMRKDFDAAIEARNRGEADLRTRSRTEMWTARYAVRRSAWHALDHAWEIEDRLQ